MLMLFYRLVDVVSASLNLSSLTAAPTLSFGDVTFYFLDEILVLSVPLFEIISAELLCQDSSPSITSSHKLSF